MIVSYSTQDYHLSSVRYHLIDVCIEEGRDLIKRIYHIGADPSMVLGGVEHILLYNPECLQFGIQRRGLRGGHQYIHPSL